MIKKFEKLNNILSYSFFNWDLTNPSHGNNPTDPCDVFKKNNILFAENGNGKSKVVDIFKSINGQSISLDKNWDRSKSDSQEANIILEDGSTVEFDGFKWSNDKLKEKFLIFDKFFIEEFVHSVGSNHLDTPQRRQQRGRNIVYLGNFAEFNSEIDRINNLKTSISDKNDRFLETEQSKIEGLADSRGITLDVINDQRTAIEKLNEKELDQKRKDLLELQNELQSAEKAIKERNKIETLLLLTEMSEDFNLDTVVDNKKIKLNPLDLFSFTITKGIRKTLEKIALKQNFIKEGVALIGEKTSECPFCEQKIRNGDFIQVIKDYQTIFDDAFSEEEKNVRSRLLAYKNILENLQDVQTPDHNQTRVVEAKAFIEFKKDLDLLSLTEQEKNTIKEEICLITEKEARMLDKIEGSKIDDIKKIFTRVVNFKNKYNKHISEINVVISQLQKDIKEGKIDTKKAETESKINKLNNEIFFIENISLFKNYFICVDQHKANSKVVDSIERIYQSSKNKMVEEFNKFVSEYFTLVKDFIKEISPAMEILDIGGQATYDRRNARDPAQCGFCVKYNNKDCSGCLSEGEKQVVALAFFFAQLRKESNKDKIVVLDDPITSFDAGKRKSTAEVIQRETKNFNQLFIFTCDPLFREYCLKQIENRNFYYVFKTLGASSIHYVPCNRETIYAAFESEFKDIDNILGSNENVIIYGQKLRFCLETKIKEDYFGYSQDKLSNMIEQVASQGRKNLVKIIDKKDEILRIYNYCNTGGLAHYPKDGSTSWNELKDKIKQYLALEL